MDPAARLREHLADAKRRGRGFDWSWRTGRTAALAAFDGHQAERQQWASALAATRPAWRRAYAGADPSPGEGAVAAVGAALAERERPDPRAEYVGLMSYDFLRRYGRRPVAESERPPARRSRPRRRRVAAAARRAADSPRRTRWTDRG